MAIDSILVVCVGNICRSPMARALIADALPDVSVVSAGTDAMVGQEADHTAQALMNARGLDISSHRAQQISRSLCLGADIILVMDINQRRYLQAHYPFVTGKVFRLGEFINADVPDPYRQSLETFQSSLQIIDRCVSAWIDRVSRIN